MPDGEAGESWAKNPASLTEPPGWSWQEAQGGLEGGAGPGGLRGAGQVCVWGPPRPQLHRGPGPGPPLGGPCLSLGRAGISWLHAPGAAIQHLGSRRYFYWVLLIQSSAFEICFCASHPQEESWFGYNCATVWCHLSLKNNSPEWGLTVPEHTWPHMGVCGGLRAAHTALSWPSRAAAGGPAKPVWRWALQRALHHCGSRRPSFGGLRSPVTKAKDLLCSETFWEHLGSEAHPQAPPSTAEPLPEGSHSQPLRS